MKQIDKDAGDYKLDTLSQNGAPCGEVFDIIMDM